MRASNDYRFRIVAIVFALVALLGACDEDDEIFYSVEGPNEPPVIITQGPDFPSETVELVSTFYAPQPWVLVGDPDGLEDITAVFLNVDTIRVHEILIRPDNGDGGCVSLEYTPNDTIDTTTLVPMPAELPGLKDQAWTLDEGGIYRPAMFNPFGVPDLAQDFEAFGFPSGCATGAGWFDWLVLLPPAVPEPLDVFLTYVEVEYIGISVTVYDKVGETATTTFPDLRIIYTTEEEKAVAP